MLQTPAERIVCAGLRGEVVVVTGDVLEAARRHRVHWLLHDRQSVSFMEPAWAAGVKREVLHAAALDARRDEDTRALLDALSASGIDTLIFKGAALAHLIYTAPHLRPRTDIDILIRAEDRDRAGGVLEASGWRRPPEPDLDESAAQRHYVRQGPGRTAWLADVHWKVANPRVFGDAVSFDDLRSRTIPLPALGAGALTPGLCDALLLACMHRVAHHDDEVDLLWLWDVHLLVERIADRDVELFGHLARRAGMTAVCRSGIELGAALFGSRRALELLDQLRSSAYEPSARFVGGARRVTVFASDLGSLATWRSRWRLLTEHLFPPVAYMRKRYHGAPRRSCRSPTRCASPVVRRNGCARPRSTAEGSRPPPPLIGIRASPTRRSGDGERDHLVVDH